MPMKVKYVYPLNDLWVIDYDDMLIYIFWLDTIPPQDHFDFVLFFIEILACSPSFLRSEFCENEPDWELAGWVWFREYWDSSFSRVRALGGPLDEEIVQFGEGPENSQIGL